MDLEVGAQQLLGHGRALDVPAGPALAPRRGPLGVLALLVRLPQREVARALLELGGVVALALAHLQRRAVGQLAVGREAVHAEVHVAAGLVGVAALDQVGDQRHDRVHGGRRLGLVVGAAQAQARGVVHVVGGHLGGQLLAGRAGLAGRVVDLVVHVGDVLDQRDLQPLVLEEALEQREHHERAGVAHVHARVDGGPAGVDAHLAGLARLQRLQLAGERVVDADLGARAGGYGQTGGRASAQGRSASIWAASDSSVCSSPGRPDQLDRQRQPVGGEARGHAGGGLAGGVPHARVGVDAAHLVHGPERALALPLLGADRRARGHRASSARRSGRRRC